MDKVTFGELPLTHPQKRVWYIEKVYPNTCMYNIGGSIRIKGKVDFSYLVESINTFIIKNEGIRLQFRESDGEVRQYISTFKRQKIDIFDFRVYDNPISEFENWVAKEAKKPFVLEESSLYYFAMFKINEYDNGYFVKFHHLISDGWSINIMTEQICSIYMKLIRGEDIYCESGNSYVQYIEQENAYLNSNRFIKNKKYWMEKFSTLPDEFLSKSTNNIAGNRKTYCIDENLSFNIKEVAGKHKISLNTFFVSVLLIYLLKTTQREDIVIGIPVVNRSGKTEKSIFGMFTSTMPFRIRMENQPVSQFLQRVNEELLHCYFNQKYPYDLLVQDLELKKKGYDNLFQLCVNYYNTSLNTELDGSPIENMEFYSGNQIYSLQLVIKDWSVSGELNLDFDYKIDDYEEHQIDKIYEQFMNIIEQILVFPKKYINNISLLSESENSRIIYGFNNTAKEYPTDKTVYELFEEQSGRTPNKVAVSFEGKGLTYKELNDKSNRLAVQLRHKGVDREVIVGLMTTHSIETIIGILGIIKAGGAYLPIDPDYPPDRINYMLSDSGASILLTNCIENKLLNFNCKIINLDDDTLYKGEADKLEALNEAGDLVYVIYTSGSTGKPKGVMITHQGLTNYIWWAKNTYLRHQDEIFPLYSSLSFDLTVTSIFTPLISGGKIIVYRDNEAEFVLFRIMRENEVSIVKLTPAHLSLIKNLHNGNSSVKRFIVGGEDLKVSLAASINESFGSNIEIYNEYGPTETVVGCMIHKYDYEKDSGMSVPIGIPSQNTQIYVLDKDLKPVPVGSIGELYIAGDGVARGYLYKPDLTSKCFIENPFIAGKRMYKTGDLARFISYDCIEYVGRVDHQVKVRGYRIELREIEKYLLTHEIINDAVVINRKSSLGGNFLCAYIKSDAEICDSIIRNYLSKFLPEYMIPSYFIKLDEIPFSTNGKVNRDLLPDPEKSNNKINYVPPRDESEKKLIEVVGEILKVSGIGVKDNFFYMGGDSIKAIQVSAKLGEIGSVLKIKDILTHPIIEDMALYLGVAGKNDTGQRYCEGSIKYIPITKWFFDQEFKNINYYNQSIILTLKEDITPETFEKALDIIVRYHDSLRLNYDFETNGLYYNNLYITQKNKLEVVDLSGYTPHEQTNNIIQKSVALKSSLFIDKGILIKACMFDLGRLGKKILITAHHLIVDGVSWRIILEDLVRILKALSCKKELLLPPKSDSIQKWALELEKYSLSDALNELEFWRKIINHDFAFPADYLSNEQSVEYCKTLVKHLSEEETALMLSNANTAYNTEAVELLLISLALSINSFTGCNDVVFEVEGHGREQLYEQVDIFRTVGWFTSIYPVLIEVGYGELSIQIKSIKEQIRKIPNKGIDFGVLKYLSQVLPGKDDKKIRFNFLGDFENTFDNDYFELSSEYTGEDTDKNNDLTALIDIIAMIKDKKLNLSFTYCKKCFNESTIVDFFDKFINQIKVVVKHCAGKDCTEFTPSDFDTVDINQAQIDSLFS